MRETYKKIFKLLNEHEDEIVFDVKSLEARARAHLYGLELKEKHGINIDPKTITSTSWNRFGDYMSIGTYGDENKRSVSWSDDGSQPVNEMLLEISFPTGGYIFGQDYPAKFFQKFFTELKTYGPKYSDTTNASLYFSMDNAGKIFNKFNSILEKYNKENKEDYKKRQIIKKKEELEKLMTAQ